MLKRGLLGGLVIIFVFLRAPAQDVEQAASPTGQVTLEKTENYSDSYKNRRGKNGALFSVTAEKFYPSEYYSLFLDAGMGDISDDSATLVGVELGYKRNLDVGSVAILGNYAQGGIDGSFGGGGRNLSFVKQGLSVNYALDNIMQEPYVVPYVQGGAHQFLVTESGTTGDQSATAGIAFNYRFGLLFQLDWLEDSVDKTAKTERLRSSGLENTYIDVYYAEYLASSNAAEAGTGDGDPNLSSSGQMGVGLKLEF